MPKFEEAPKVYEPRPITERLERGISLKYDGTFECAKAIAEMLGNPVSIECNVSIDTPNGTLEGAKIGYDGLPTAANPLGLRAEYTEVPRNFFVVKTKDGAEVMSMQAFFHKWEMA